jgi:hypothetical protein
MSQKIATPIYSHLTYKDFEFVYEPAEDSFLLLDAIEIELETLKILRPTFCVEIGPGSGIISAGIGSALKSECFIMACDINIKVQPILFPRLIFDLCENFKYSLNDTLLIMQLYSIVDEISNFKR